MQKALRGMEAGLDGWSLPKGYKRLPKDQLYYKLRVPNPDRIIFLKQVGGLGGAEQGGCWGGCIEGGGAPPHGGFVEGGEGGCVGVWVCWCVGG